MKLKLTRIFLAKTYVIGKLYVNGKYYCDTLEDADRAVKIQHETCINTGTYNVIVNMSNRFKRLLPLLENVPEFEGIRIHSGNTDKDSSGCILVGKNTIKGQLTDSRTYMNMLTDLLLSEQKKGIKSTIEIV